MAQARSGLLVVQARAAAVETQIYKVLRKDDGLVAEDHKVAVRARLIPLAHPPSMVVLEAARAALGNPAQPVVVLFSERLLEVVGAV